MAKLHESIEASRKILIGFALAIAASIVLVILFNIGKKIRDTFFPAAPPPPNVAFGILPAIPFPATGITSKFSYTINTISGALPQLSNRSYIYALAQPSADLLALNRVKQMVGAANFSGQPHELSSSMYQWVNADPLPKRLTVNVFTLESSLASDYIGSSVVLAAVNLPDLQHADLIAQTFLQSLSLFPDDIDLGRTRNTLYGITNGTLAPAVSLSGANVVRVDYYQKNIHSLPILYPHPPLSTMNVLVAAGPSAPQVVEMHLIHKEIDPRNATYPLKTADEAFGSLKKGDAYLASYDGGGAVTIRDVFLGYYVSDGPQSYLMPIIVFSGDDNFVAYVSAIKDEWVHK